MLTSIKMNLFWNDELEGIFLNLQFWGKFHHPKKCYDIEPSSKQKQILETVASCQMKKAIMKL